MKQEYQNLFEAVMNCYTEIVREKMLLEKYELCESVRRVKWTINKDDDGDITYDITTYNGSGCVEDEYSSCDREEALECRLARRRVARRGGYSHRLSALPLQPR